MTFGNYQQFNMLGLGGGYPMIGGCGYGYGSYSSNSSLGMQLGFMLAGIAGNVAVSAVKAHNSQKTVSPEVTIESIDKKINEIVKKIGCSDIQDAMNKTIDKKYQDNVNEAKTSKNTAEVNLKTAEGNLRTVKLDLINAKKQNADEATINDLQAKVNLAETKQKEAEAALQLANEKLNKAIEDKKSAEVELRTSQAELDKLFNQKQELEAKINNDKSAQKNIKLFNEVDGSVGNREKAEDINNQFDANGNLKSDAQVNIRSFRGAFSQYRLSEGNEAEQKKWAKKCIVLYEQLRDSGSKDLKKSDIEAYINLKSKAE